MNLKLLICAWLGHSQLVTYCFGYESCARCGTQIADTLGGAKTDLVIVNDFHVCDQCKTRYKTLGWKDKLLSKKPEWKISNA